MNTGIWAWDEANHLWRKVLIDATGHLQVDTLSSALPTGAATGGRQDVQTDVLSLIRLLLVAGESFGGNVYSKTMLMADDNPTRFETTAKKLRDVVIIVKTHPMLLGETGVVVYPVGANETVGFTKVDISTLYFQNASAGDDATISILGVEE